MIKPIVPSLHHDTGPTLRWHQHLSLPFAQVTIDIVRRSLFMIHNVRFRAEHCCHSQTRLSASNSSDPTSSYIHLTTFPIAPTKPL